MAARGLVCVGCGCLVGVLAGCTSAARVVPPGLVEDVLARHARVYEAFTVGPSPDALHALLSEVYVGEALTGAYVDHFRTLTTLAAQDVGVAVQGVEHAVSAVEATGDGVVLDVVWHVRSTIRHEAHTHARVARTRGRLEVQPTPAGPRIRREWIADLQRVRSGLRADDLFDGGGTATERGLVDPLELLEAGVLDGEEDR